MASLDLRRGETASRDAIRDEIERCGACPKPQTLNPKSEALDRALRCVPPCLPPPFRIGRRRGAGRACGGAGVTLKPQTLSLKP